MLICHKNTALQNNTLHQGFQTCGPAVHITWCPHLSYFFQLQNAVQLNVNKYFIHDAFHHRYDSSKRFSTHRK